MSWFKHEKEATPKAKFEVEVLVDGKSYITGMSQQPANANLESRISKHSEKLIAFYDKQAQIFKYGSDITPELLKSINPNANENTCPYCGTIHPFTASRARKCPACGEKMVVRSGRYVTETQAKDLQDSTTAYYDKAQELEKLKNKLQSIQDDKLRRVYGRCFIEIAEAYESCAIILNESYQGGYTNWDYAWGVLNREVLEAISNTSRSQRELLSNGYAEVLYARGMHLLREMKCASGKKARNRYGTIAISMFYEYLYQLEKYKLDDWRSEDAVKNIHIAMKLGDVSSEEAKQAAQKAISHPGEETGAPILGAIMTRVRDFKLIENDPARLMWMIY